MKHSYSDVLLLQFSLEIEEQKMANVLIELKKKKKPQTQKTTKPQTQRIWLQKRQALSFVCFIHFPY